MIPNNPYSFATRKGSSATTGLEGTGIVPSIPRSKRAAVAYRTQAIITPDSQSPAAAANTFPRINHPGASVELLPVAGGYAATRSSRFLRAWLVHTRDSKPYRQRL